LETAVKKLYEGMFLIDSAEAAKDWDGIMELVRKTLVKADAEIVSIRKWDERALAYTIRRCGRGTYILTYFRADGQKIRDIERDVQLSDRIMRALILKADHITEDAIANLSTTLKTGEALQKSEDPPQSGEVSPLADRGQRIDVPSSVIKEQTRDPSRLGVEPRQDETQH